MPRWSTCRTFPAHRHRYCSPSASASTSRLAHALKPVIRLGNAGLTPAVLAETARALGDHELIKVKAPGGDREARDELFAALARSTGSALVKRIGNVAVLYRPAPQPRILIPDR